MRISSTNSIEKLNELNSKNGKNRVYYKLISFATRNENGNINFKLAPNVLITIILFFVFIILINFAVIIPFKIPSGFSNLVQLVVAGYASLEVAKYLTEKFFKRQLMEFYKLIQEWKVNKN